MGSVGIYGDCRLQIEKSHLSYLDAYDSKRACIVRSGANNRSVSYY
jgi:hypothetical protein